MMSLTFGLFTQVSGSGPLGPLVMKNILIKFKFHLSRAKVSVKVAVRRNMLLAVFYET